MNGKEYELLKEQMLADLEDIVKYNLALYSSTAAILTFAFSTEGPIIRYLLPYAILIPLCLLTERKRNAISEISTYMIVFLENDQSGFAWETRRHRLDKSEESSDFWKNLRRWSGKIISPRLSYFLTALLCSFAAIYKILNPTGATADSPKLLPVVAVLIFTVAAMLIMASNIRNYSIERGVRIEKWKKVKEIEERAKKDTNHHTTE